MKQGNQNANVRYESSDAKPRRLLLLALGLVMVVLLLMAALWGIYGARLRPPAASADLGDASQFSYGAEWEDRVTQDRKKLWAKERERLSTYAWLDQSHTALRVPINDVLDHLSEAGLPVWEPVITPSTSPYTLVPDDE